MSVPEGYETSFEWGGGEPPATPSEGTKKTKETKEGVLDGGFLRFPRFFRTPRDLRPLGEVAYSGLAGRVVNAIAPTTEASREALLASLLTMFGNAVGPRPHVKVGADLHRPNLFAVLVGPSGTGRKGMAISHAEQVVGRADTDWRDCIVRGLASGEGVIWKVRDPVVELDAETGDQRIVEEGTKDKRLLVREDEFASVLAAMGRDGSTLSGVLRDAWDGRRLQTLAKRSPAVASGAHVSVLAAITQAEALRKLTATEQANGFANRFLWVYSERSQLLPDGFAVDEALLGELASEIARALGRARGVDTVIRDDDAKELWRDVYPRLTRDVPGMTGAMRSRAESQTLRLSLCYALLDGERLIRRHHVAAALELWDYAERSLFRIFGDTLGDPSADRLLTELREAPAGLTRTDITKVFSRNVPANEIERALGVLAEARLAFQTSEETGGRPVERWHATTDSTSHGETVIDPPEATRRVLHPGDEGFDEFLLAAVNAGHITQDEAVERYDLHKLIVQTEGQL